MYRFRNVTQGNGVLTFLDLIWATNDAAEASGEARVFGAPDLLGREGHDYEGRFVEIYPEAVVIGPISDRWGGDDGWRVVPKTKRAARLMRLGAISIKYPNVPEED